MLETAEVLRRFHTLPDELETVVKNLTPEQLTTPYLKDEWTVAQNVHHAADVHVAFFFRFKAILLGEHPTVTPFDQDVWAKSPDATRADITDSLMIIRGISKRWIALIEGMQESDWSKTGFHPENGEVVLGNFIDYASQHGHLHVAQIKKTLAAGKIQH